jgi:hypothetical protein
MKLKLDITSRRKVITDLRLPYVLTSRIIFIIFLCPFLFDKLLSSHGAIEKARQKIVKAASIHLFTRWEIHFTPFKGIEWQINKS